MPYPSFNAGLFLSLLKTRFLGRNVLHFHSLDSTNNHARNLMKEGTESVLVVAETQTAGRGRQGKAWDSPPSIGLYFSVGVKGGFPGRELLTLRTAVTLAKSLQKFTPHNIGIKWPNDLWVKKKKLAGILVESKMAKGLPEYYIIGVGINLYPGENQHPEWACLFQRVEPYVKERILADFLLALEDNLSASWTFEQFNQEWKRLDLLSGHRVWIFQDPSPWSGIAQGIDNTGALQVVRDDGVAIKLHSAAVSVRPAENDFS